MNPSSLHPDLLVIGSGPAGHKAAIQGAKMGKRVILVEQERDVGGACVHRGTIPSKTLRETAVALSGFKRRTGNVFDIRVREDLQVASLMSRMEQVVKAHHRFMGNQLERNGVEYRHGRARFQNPREVEVLAVDGRRTVFQPEIVLIATGSRPRNPKEIPIDHQNILDSDSILSMTYLPSSLVVLGSGVIACEYASIFAELGVRVTLIDKYPRPLGFLDEDLSDRFSRSFHSAGGRYLGGCTLRNLVWDGVSSVQTTLEGGEEVRSDKVLFALGREANLDGIDVHRAGIEVGSNGFIVVDERCRTNIPHIFAAGDVIGPPALAASSMEQGRRAICNAFGLDVGSLADVIPSGIYTIPEIAMIGRSEAQARKEFGEILVGRASFEELARGQIAAIQEGQIKLVSDGEGKRLLGVQIIGEGAAELIHVGQMALLQGADVDVFLDNIFNFPTLAEGYRVAAFEVVQKRNARRAEPTEPLAALP